MIINENVLPAEIKYLTALLSGWKYKATQAEPDRWVVTVYLNSRFDYEKEAVFQAFDMASVKARLFH